MDLSTLSHTGGPVLFWRGPEPDALDLTGPVIANWVHKGIGLFGDHGLGPEFTLWVPSPKGLHWRELVAVLSVLLGGGKVFVGSAVTGSAVTGSATAGSAVAGAGSTAAAAAPEDEFIALVPSGSEDDESLLDAEEVLVFNPPALALHTPVDAGFIDMNSTIRAYPDVSSRRLSGDGELIVNGHSIDWRDTAWRDTAWRDTGAQNAGTQRPSGLLLTRATPLPEQWPQFLGHLLGAGEILLYNGPDEQKMSDLADSLGTVRGRLGAWTK